MSDATTVLPRTALCASRHRQSLSLRFGIPVFRSDFRPAGDREELTGNVINLEGHDLVSVPLGFTDTDSTTCLHVPPIGLVVAGDAAYNSDHLHLSESPDQQKRQEWIAALDKMESLKPRAVIAGNKHVGNDDSARIIEETRQYIRDFERLAMQTTTVRELYDQMLKLYPDWINRGALWSSVHATKT